MNASKAIDATLTIIEANAIYASVFAQLHAECFDKAWSKDDFVKFLNMPGAAGFLASQNADPETPIGFALVGGVKIQPEILSIGVLPNHQRKGVGLHLLKTIHRKCFYLGTTEIFLEVNANNNGAVSFYDQAGYRPVGRRDNYYARSDARLDDALIMCAKLEDPNI